jgi:FkbM family methyltransferase
MTKQKTKKGRAQQATPLLSQEKIQKIGEQIDSLKQDAPARRIKLIKANDIDAIFDVGANTGQYALEMRALGWKGPIVSFEPLSDAFQQLQKNASKDKSWSTHQYALGSRNTSLMINVSGESRASSLLPMLPAHTDVASYFKTVKQEKVTVKKLDSVIDEIAKAKKRIYLKLDAQGYEKKILSGAKESLALVQGIQIELSLTALYQGETPIEQMLLYLRKLGFRLMSLEYGFTNPKTGAMLQADGIFFREA